MSLTKIATRNMKEKKSLLVFPLLSLCFSIGLLVIALYYLLQLEGTTSAVQHTPIKSYIILCVILLFLFKFTNLITLFFNVSATAYILHHMQGQPCRLRDAFKVAVQHTKTIYLWLLVAVTYGTFIRFMSMWDDDWSKKRMSAWLHGLTWRSATYLVIPVWLAEQLGTWQAMHRSAALMNKCWPNATSPNTPMLSIGFLLKLVAIIFYVTAAALGGKIMLVLAIIFLVIVFFGITTFTATVFLILFSALYLFSTDQYTGPESDLPILRSAFAGKKRRAKQPT